MVDNVVHIGSDTIIVGGVKAGNNIKIHATCVTYMDAADNCTVVLPKPRIIDK